MSGAHHEPWDLSDDERARYRRISNDAREAKRRALRGEGPAPVHPINQPALDPLTLMPARQATGLSALSLFSGGGGLDLGFQRAGYHHVASYEILQDAANTLTKANPEWTVYGGPEGDVTGVDWRPYRDSVDVLHGGPPCQPFSAAGRQLGKSDSRDMFGEFVRAVLEARPRAFVAENVPALLHAKFAEYLRSEVLGPLSRSYQVTEHLLAAEAFGVPQVRRRVVFVGFRNTEDAARYGNPPLSHAPHGTGLLDLRATMGARQALGLPDIGFDALAPTIRSALTGPRKTTSVISSVSAGRVWERLGIWPNGVAPTREQAHVFVPENRNFRLSVPDCAVLQGFPETWPFQGPTYMMLGQIGNAVAPPVGYAIAAEIARALSL